MKGFPTLSHHHQDKLWQPWDLLFVFITSNRVGVSFGVDRSVYPWSSVCLHLCFCLVLHFSLLFVLPCPHPWLPFLPLPLSLSFVLCPFPFPFPEIVEKVGLFVVVEKVSLFVVVEKVGRKLVLFVVEKVGLFALNFSRSFCLPFSLSSFNYHLWRRGIWWYTGGIECGPVEGGTTVSYFIVVVVSTCLDFSVHYQRISPVVMTLRDSFSLQVGSHAVCSELKS